MFTFLLSCFHFLSVIFFPHHAVLHAHTHFAPTPTITVSATPTNTPTPITTDTPMLTPTLTQTPTLIPLLTDSPTPTITFTPTPTMTPTQTKTPSLTPTSTPDPTVSPTSTEAPTPTATPSLTPILTPSPSPAPTAILTPTLTPLPTTTPTTTIKPTTTPSTEPTTTVTLTPTEHPTPTLTPDPTASPSPTLTPTPTVSETPIPSTVPSVTVTPTPTITKIGNDISYPQCGNTLPTGQGFGIVGINGGIATTTNPCLSTELLWANLSLGTLNQAKVQLYVNTGNPGGLNTASWPNNNTDPSGTVSPNPNGICDGSDSVACAWQYGWNRAVDDVQHKFIPAAQTANVDAVASDYPWWLDVETTNSWESGSDAAFQKNTADLEAMVTYFQSKGITAGIYSTGFQWDTIVHTLPSGSNLNKLHTWLPGAQDLAGVQSNCSLSSFISGGSVILTQFTTNNFDYDYSCL